MDLWEVGSDLAVMIPMWPLLPKVSYRRRDVLTMVVPYYYGLWVVGLVVWRLSGLPYRGWRPRDDEMPRVRLIRGGPLYVLLRSAPAESATARGRSTGAARRSGFGVARGHR